MAGLKLRILVISGHDYRSKRKTSIHFMVNEWSKTNYVRFFSVGFSFLSVIKRDARSDLIPRANAIETYQNVECYLQRSLLHPVALKTRFGSSLNQFWIEQHVSRAPGVLHAWASNSDIIVIDAGLALAYLPALPRPGGRVRYLYNVSDRLETIGCSSYLIDILNSHYMEFDGIRVPAPGLRNDFPASDNVRYIPQGISEEDHVGSKMPRPFSDGLHAVSIGSMLFDARTIAIAAAAFPELTIHVIGAGRSSARLNRRNIHVHLEMPFRQTQAFLAHSDIGFAAYDLHRVEPYLADSSLKLAQFAAYGIPAVCPESVTNGLSYRYGYNDDPASVCDAVRRALATGRFPGVRGQPWQKTAEDFLALAVG